MTDFLMPAPEPAFELLDVITATENVTVAEEGLKEFWEKTKERVAIMLGQHEAMVKYVESNVNNFARLNDEKFVRTVMPKDLLMAAVALEDLSKLLVELRKGDPLQMSEKIGKSVTDVGIELKEDGRLYANKFQCGNWGEGKGKTNLSKPMTFKKKVGEFNWKTNGPTVSRKFISAIKLINKRDMQQSLDNHYRDLTRAVASKQEKSDLEATKRVAINQTRNLLAVRNLLARFIFKQLTNVLAAGTVMETSGSNDESTGGYY